MLPAAQEEEQEEAMARGERDRLQRIISATAAGAGMGAAALRRAGVEVDLEDFGVEVTVDDEQSLSAIVRIAFVPQREHGVERRGGET